MEITCFACQQKLQIADGNAGQMVRCPACAATFQAPSLPSTGPLPPPEALVASNVPPSAPVVAPQSAQPAPVHPEPGPAPYAPAQPMPRGDYSGGFTITLRQQIVALISPVGLVILFILSFFPWRHTAPVVEGVTLSLWELAFSQAGFAVFLLYVLLLIVAAPIVFFTILHDRQLVPTPAPLRPYLPWAPAIAALLSFAAWFFFLTHYLQCTFMESIDPTTIWMKLAFRLHTLMVIAALLDLCLQRRKPQGLPDPIISVRW
jgi:hypothetical protein